MSTQITHPTNSPSGDRRTIAVKLPAAANPGLINTAAGVIKAAMAQGNREAYSLAFTLDAAGLLQSPETAAELTALRNVALNTPLGKQRLAEILARAEAATPGPWCTDAWEIYQGTEYEPGFSAWIGETCRGTSTPEQDRADAEFVAAARTDVPELVAAVQLLTAEVAELEAQRERRRVRLVALQNDALNVRGALSPNGEPRKVPMPLGETLAPAVEWLLGRVAELEAAASAVRGQHYEVDGSPNGDGSCIQCGSDYPCATVRALSTEAPDRAKVLAEGLTDTERQFLTFALELAADQMAFRGDEFDDEDDAALDTLRRVAAEPDDDRMSNEDFFTASELYEMDRDDEFRLDAEDDA